MMRDQWNELVLQNPMLIEITRFRRRYFTFSAANSVTAIVFGLVLICYASIVMIVVENRDSISPIHLISFQTALICIFAPMTLYNSIAGERERRSWDLLLAAPITKAQIVVGKFIGAMAALGIALLMLQVPVLITAFSFDRAHWSTVVRADCLSLTFSMFVCALTILFSARVKRGLMALGATLGTLMSLLVVLPSIATTGGGEAQSHFTDVAFYLHPFVVLSRLNNLDEYYYELSGHLVMPVGSPGTGSPAVWDSYVAPILWGWPQTLTYLGMTVVLLAWAANTLSFAENEVKFLPQGHKDA